MQLKTRGFPPDIPGLGIIKQRANGDIIRILLPHYCFVMRL